MLSVPWVTQACFLIGPLGFDARLWTREQRNSWEKAMQTLILPELEVRASSPAGSLRAGILGGVPQVLRPVSLTQVLSGLLVEPQPRG